MDCRNNILFLNIMFVIVERSSSCSATFVLCFSREIILTLVKIYLLCDFVRFAYE